VHDVGALTYFGNYRVLDIEGLASPRFRKASRLHAAGVWEAIETMASAELPRYLAVYTNWYNRDFLGEHTQLFVQRQFRPSIAAGNPLTVYAANWSLAGSGNEPRDPAVRERIGRLPLLARIDVADLESEHAAGYGFHVLDDAYEDLLRKLPAGGAAVLDGGRLISGSEAFTVAVPAGQRALLVARSHAPFRIRVSVDGADAGVWTAAGGGNGWNEAAFALPASPRSRRRIELASDDPHHSAYGSFHYWVYASP
jgi:hypothetical protein